MGTLFCPPNPPMLRPVLVLLIDVGGVTNCSTLLKYNFQVLVSIATPDFYRHFRGKYCTFYFTTFS